MKIIFRNPNVTGFDMLMGLAYTERAKVLMEEAQHIVRTNLMDSRWCELVTEANDLLQKAAECAGFRNAKDMKDYLDIYGTL